MTMNEIFIKNTAQVDTCMKQYHWSSGKCSQTLGELHWRDSCDSCSLRNYLQQPRCVKPHVPQWMQEWRKHAKYIKIECYSAINI